MNNRLREGESGHGDGLASGRVKSQTYTGVGVKKSLDTSDPEVINDLQNLTKDEFVAKYFDFGASEIMYDSLIKSLSEDEPEPPQPVPVNTVLQEVAATAVRPTYKGIPVGDQILVQSDDAVVASKGGIVLPENARQKTDQGVVVDVGPGWRDRVNGALYPCCVVPGQRILFNRFASMGKEIELDGNRLLIISDIDVMLILEEVNAGS